MNSLFMKIFMKWSCIFMNGHLCLLYKFGILTIFQIRVCTGVYKQDDRHSPGQMLGNRVKKNSRYLALMGEKYINILEGKTFD